MKWDEWREGEKIYACWLCNFPYIGNAQIHRLSDCCGGPEGAYFAGRTEWGKVLSPKQVEHLAAYTASWRPELEYRKMTEEGISILTMTDSLYPQRLRDIPDPPFALFVRGQFPSAAAPAAAPAVAVVGARECSEYGRYVAGQLGEMLGRQGVTVISGMARGIDGISQAAAMESGGYSVGVLGSGVDICYPAQNKPIYQKLLERGALLSPYPLGTPARPQNFPPRNRIVSGLADVVVVIEARVKSGTLITVDMALEQGREVYVVPGRVTDRLSDGCNRLIKQGAGIFLGPESFLEEVWQLWEARQERLLPKIGRGDAREGKNPRKGDRPGRTDSAQPGREIQVPPDLAEIYGALDFYPKSAEEIRQSLPPGCADMPVAPLLMRLCLENLAVQVSPGHFRKRGE